MACSIETYRLRIGMHNLKTTKIKHKYNTTNTDTTTRTHLAQTALIMTLLILTSINPNTIYKTSKQHNREQHIKNGNHTIKLLHWNKGKALFHNKLNDIDTILDKFKPHVISLCEANIDKIIPPIISTMTVLSNLQKWLIKLICPAMLF